MFTVGGVVFCDKCASIASLQRKSRLHNECEPPEGGVVAGPLARINALLRGNLKGTGLTRWPDGSSSSATLKASRFLPPTTSRIKDGSNQVSPQVVSETRIAASGPPLTGFANQPFGESMSSLLSTGLSVPVPHLSRPFFWLQSNSSSSNDNSNSSPSG